MKSPLLKNLSIILFGIFICPLILLGQPTNLNPIKDNSIYSENNNSNGLGELFSGRTGVLNGNNFRRALIKFDLSSIPTGATITNVTLMINVSADSPGAGTETYRIHGLTKDWGEGTSVGGGTGALAVAPDTTWNQAMFGTSSWTTPGGDFTASVASLNISGIGNRTFLSTSNFVSLVQAWLNNPTSNNGLILIGDETISNSARRFGSKEVGVKPLLSVNWSPPLSTDEFSISNFSISPNPSHTEIKLQLPETVSSTSIKVFNILGKEVYSSSKYEAPIKISNWQNGIYLVQVSDLESTKTKRFIKL
jgi:hypothetical protein